MLNKRFIDVFNTFITNPKVESITVDHKQIILLVEDSLISSVISYAQTHGYKKVFLSTSHLDKHTLIRF